MPGLARSSGSARPLSTIISLVRLMDKIVSNYPVEGPIMRLTFLGYKLMRRASHLHSIKLIAPQAEGRMGDDGRIVFLKGF
jgi:hypothetical protein